MKKHSIIVFCLFTFALRASLAGECVPSCWNIYGNSVSAQMSCRSNVHQRRLRVKKAGEWLHGQQNEQTGLLRSYNMPGDWMAWTYDQALGIIALLEIGDVNTAAQCADGMLAIRRNTNDPNCPTNVWVDGYNSSNGNEVAKAIAVGPNAWMGLALLNLYRITGDSEYLLAAQHVAEFILDLQAQNGCADGSVSGGYDEDCLPFSWTSTEHNADAMALLLGLAQVSDANAEDYRSAAVRIAEWLDREMWDSDLACYLIGYADYNQCTISDFSERLDSQTWTLLALQVMANRNGNNSDIADLIHNGLPWIDHYVCQVNYNDCNLAGFAKVTWGLRATDSFWAEGTAGYVLAAGAACHSKENQIAMLDSLRCLQNPDGSIPYSVGVTCPEINQYFEPCDIILAHFEGHPHCLYGQVGVYGDGAPNWDAIEDANYSQPYSWYYEPEKPGYDTNNVHSCWQSFRLVNATEMCLTQNQNWASLGLDMGPIENGDIKFRDVSDCQEFIFWAKTDNNDNNNIEVLFKDADWVSDFPQVSLRPVPPRLRTSWTEHHVNLADINGINGLNLRKLEHVGLAFGNNVGNSPGTIICVDDMGFIGSGTMTPLSNGANMPAAFPQNWPYASVAATAWFIFTELQTNPFAVGCKGPLKPYLIPACGINSCPNFYNLALRACKWLKAPGCPPHNIVVPKWR